MRMRPGVGVIRGKGEVLDELSTRASVGTRLNFFADIDLGARDG